MLGESIDAFQIEVSAGVEVFESDVVFEVIQIMQIAVSYLKVFDQFAVLDPFQIAYIVVVAYVYFGEIRELTNNVDICQLAFVGFDNLD